MNRMSLKQALGKWVTGDDFWDREEDLALFRERIAEGAHVLLVAQRRMGKTSLMQEARAQLADRYTCVFVDLQKCFNASEAIVELSLAIHPYKPLWNRTKEVFTNIREKVTDGIEKVNIGELGVTLRAGLTAGNWADKGDELFAILAGSEKGVVLLLDEVPLMVNRILKGEDFAITPERKRATEEFMSWLRKNSIKHQGRVSIVVSGSIGLEPVLRQAGLSATLNNFVPFELKPWEDRTAVACIEALANKYGVDLQAGAAAAMVHQLGCCIPHHIQMFFSYVYERCKRSGRMQFSADEVDQIYRAEMLGVRGHVELTHYEERLKLVLGKEVFSLALEMLTETAVTGCLTHDAIVALQSDYDFTEGTVVEVQKDALWVLEHDGYLTPGPKGYVFVSKLVRDW